MAEEDEKKVRHVCCLSLITKLERFSRADAVCWLLHIFPVYIFSFNKSMDHPVLSNYFVTYMLQSPVWPFSRDWSIKFSTDCLVKLKTDTKIAIH